MATLTANTVRNVNLIELLLEEAEARGETVEDIPDNAAEIWTETEIRNFFGSLQSHSGADSERNEYGATPPEPSEEEWRKWFPGLALSQTETCNPRLVVLCFPNAGSAEDMYTSEGTGRRRAPSPLLEWCRKNHGLCLAVQPPGRNLRLKEACITSAKEMAKAIFTMVAHKLVQQPYVVVAHSVGTWVAYEMLCLMRNAGLSLPQHAFLSAMASPDIPEAERPWRQQHTLSEPEFQMDEVDMGISAMAQEASRCQSNEEDECRGWDINDIVFTPALWGTYQHLMRSDFQLFDSYQFHHKGERPFPMPMTCFWGTRDKRIKPAMVQGWQKFTDSSFTSHKIDGHHLWPLDKDAKHQWLSIIVSELAKLP